MENKNKQIERECPEELKGQLRGLNTVTWSSSCSKEHYRKQR
jgi:hypothetical protein